MSDPRQTRKEQNQALFAESHERIETHAQSMRSDFVCECDDPGCMKQMPMTLPEYEAIRDKPNHFAVWPGHEQESDRVIESNDRYVVVERDG